MQFEPVAAPAEEVPGDVRIDGSDPPGDPSEHVGRVQTRDHRRRGLHPYAAGMKASERGEDGFDRRTRESAMGPIAIRSQIDVHGIDRACDPRERSFGDEAVCLPDDREASRAGARGEREGQFGGEDRLGVQEADRRYAAAIGHQRGSRRS